MSCCTFFKSYINDLFKTHTEQMNTQNIKIMEALAEQSAFTKILIRQEQTVVDLTLSFPLATEEALITMDKKINNDNKHLYVAAMKDILRNNLIKNIGLVITADLFYHYNLGGTLGKKGLKDLNNLYSALKRAVEINPKVEDVESHIRKANKFVKKRLLKKLQGSKNSARDGDEGYDDDDEF